MTLGHHLRRLVAASFIIAALFVIVADAIPDSRTSELVGRLAEPLGRGIVLPQNWALFAPAPMTTEIHVHAVVTFADGDERNWFPAHEQSRINSPAFERWRRWETAVRLDDHADYWPITVRHVLDRFDSASNPVTSIELIRSWTTVPQAGVPDDEREVADYRFFVWDRATMSGRTLGPAEQPT